MKKVYILIFVLIIIFLLVSLLIGIIVSNTNKSNDNYEILDENLYSLKFNEKINDEDKKIDTIVNLIKKNFDKKFNINYYEIGEYSNYINEKKYDNIDLVYKINDIYTNLGYQVITENNIITEITSNIKNVNIKKYEKNIQVFEQDYSYLKDEIKEKLELDRNIIVKEQKVKKMYNLFENIKKVVVLTKYTENGVQKVTDYTKILE